jgi:hypothetical protein
MSLVMPHSLGDHLFWAVCLLPTAPCLAHSQVTPDVASWAVDSLKSEVLGETRIIRIALPRDYGRDPGMTERFPVLIMLDMIEDDLLMSLVANARVLAKYEPPAI